MEGHYKAHRVTCQGCLAVQLEVDEHGHPKGAQTLYVTDDAPRGYVPDPRLMPRG